MNKKSDINTVFIQELIDVTSNLFAIKLVEKFRGQRLYIPSKMPHPKHKLCQALTKEELEVLIENFKGNQIDIPMSATNDAAERRRLILELRKKHYTISEIVTRAQCTYRWVQMVLHQEREKQSDEEQGSLF